MIENKVERLLYAHFICMYWSKRELEILTTFADRHRS